MPLDFDQCERAVRSRDPRFDGWFVVAITTTGIYCRPSCPSRPALREHLRFYATPAAAHQAGYRACKRCRPDATPGSPEWDLRADLTGRAMRLIADGVVDRDGVAGLAARLGYSERHLTRQLNAEVGAGPLAIARAQRAQTARILIETTDLPFTEVAFASGFASVRQFNDTVRAVFAATPTDLRRAARRGRSRTRDPQAVEGLRLRLPYRSPCAVEETLAFLGQRAIPGVEELEGNRYRRSLRLPHGPAVVEVQPADGHVSALLHLADLRDLSTAVHRCRRVLDLDADPSGIVEVLGADPLLRHPVQQQPGRRVPGTVSGDELAIRAVLGQQVSVAAARTHARHLTAAVGKPLDHPVGTVTHLFPAPDAVADAPDEALRMPDRRRRTVRDLGARLAEGTLHLDAGADRDATVQQLLTLPGIGPWTADYIRLRALGDPDVFLAGDLGVQRALERLGHAATPRRLDDLSRRWRPWRSYATLHLWATLSDPDPEAAP